MCDTTKFTRSGGVSSSTYASECYLALQSGKVTSTSALGSFQSFVLRYWDYSMGTPLRIKVDGNIITTLSTNAYGCGDGGCKKSWTSPVFTYGVHTIEINDTAYSEYGAQIITVALFGQAATPTPTDTATPTITLTPTDGATPTLSGSETATPTATETATPTTSPTYGPTPTLTVIPTEEAPEPLQSAKYFYDGDGNLVKSVVNSTMGNTTTTYYPGKHYSVEEKNGALKVQKHYAAGSTIIAVRTITAEADTLQWMISDHLGSTSTTANADGTWNSDIRYTAFGEIRLKSGVTASGYRYTSQLDMQGSIGLDYYVARFYDPQLARFAQADTLVPEPKSTLFFDRYAYVKNNPILYNDPTGHDAGFAAGGLTREAFMYLSGFSNEKPKYYYTSEAWARLNRNEKLQAQDQLKISYNGDLAAEKAIELQKSISEGKVSINCSDMNNACTCFVSQVINIGMGFEFIQIDDLYMPYSNTPAFFAKLTIGNQVPYKEYSDTNNPPPYNLSSDQWKAWIKQNMPGAGDIILLRDASWGTTPDSYTHAAVVTGNESGVPLVVDVSNGNSSLAQPHPIGPTKSENIWNIVIIYFSRWSQ